MNERMNPRLKRAGWLALIGCGLLVVWSLTTNELTVCVRNNAVPRLKQLVVWRPWLINRRDRWGRTPLFHAAHVGNLGAFKVLMEHNAHFDRKDTLGYTIEQQLSAEAWGRPEVKPGMLELIKQARAEAEAKKHALKWWQ